MFSYRPPKGSFWGHAMHPKHTLKAIRKTHTFLDTYFEPIKPEQLTLNLNPYLDKDNDVPKLKERADQVFGRPGRAESLDWVFPGEDYQRVVNFILECRLTPKLPADPIWLSFRCSLTWKSSVLPNVEASQEKVASAIFNVNLRSGGRFMFPLGIYIPISPTESTLYELLGKFSADAPFKMSAKHFQARIPDKRGRVVWRRPDGEIAARLNDVI
jgi:hypothetical protein